MACFSAPAAGAVATALIRRSLAKKHAGNGAAISWSEKLKWLQNLFIGGSVLLAIEHVWHGEITFSFPFLTAVKEGPEQTAEMLKEIATVGSAMTGLILLVWVGMVLVADRLVRKAEAKAEA